MKSSAPGTGGSGGTTGAGGAGGSGGSAPITGAIAISADHPTARNGSWGANYWMWAPSLGNDVAGTEAAVTALTPGILRIGGHNNDSNSPDRFTDAQVDTAVAYADAVGAEPLIQVPLIADSDGNVPTAATAAHMVAYANVTRGYGVKYFSIGNEPDLYPDADIPGYTPQDYCTSARSFVTAMRAVDPSIYIVGPDLSWKYQAGNDWLTPILTDCGDVIDVVAIHRYPFDAAHATMAAAAADAPSFAAAIAGVRTIMSNTGYATKPLAVTETNITWDGAPEKSIMDASPGTVPSGLWSADALGTALANGIWSTVFWSISEGWTLGMITPPPQRTPRPAYYAIQLYADHFGPALVDVTSAPAGVRAYASRNAADNATSVIVVNWNGSPMTLTFDVSGATTPVAPVTFTVDALTMTAVEIPDAGTPAAWTYGQTQLAAAAGPAELAPSAP